MRIENPPSPSREPQKLSAPLLQPLLFKHYVLQGSYPSGSMQEAQLQEPLFNQHQQRCKISQFAKSSVSSRACVLLKHTPSLFIVFFFMDCLQAPQIASPLKKNISCALLPKIFLDDTTDFIKGFRIPQRQYRPLKGHHDV
ncbi:Uncharacterised protein [Bartonella vinsonii]|uniref:Uncharacterized protein n=1 Tax=Bartonella vinsonii TaxID=33047 RepID=A0A3S5F8N5_BARVI|nr:Uncharacterised protein [Bartonella vinsonii]